jgi:hypothetical protein
LLLYTAACSLLPPWRPFPTSLSLSSYFLPWVKSPASLPDTGKLRHRRGYILANFQMISSHSSLFLSTVYQLVLQSDFDFQFGTGICLCTVTIRHITLFFLQTAGCQMFKKLNFLASNLIYFISYNATVSNLFIS